MKLPATQLTSLLPNDGPKVDPICEAEVEQLLDIISDFLLLLSLGCFNLNSSLSALTDMAAVTALSTVSQHKLTTCILMWYDSLEIYLIVISLSS